MGEINIVNARISDTFLGYEDHGIFTYTIHLDYGCGGQGAGMVSLGGEFTDRVIQGILKTVGVDSWEKLKGAYVRVEQEHTKVHKIGNLLRDKWFDISGSKIVIDD